MKVTVLSMWGALSDESGSLVIPVSLINPQSYRQKTQLASLLRDAMFTEALLGNAAESCLLLHSNQCGSAQHGMAQSNTTFLIVT
jgi:hypothetical protein